jgi:hypothetical protein
MLFYLALLLLVAAPFLTLLRNLHRFCLLEAIDRSGADLLTSGKDVGFYDIMIAVIRRRIRIHLRQNLDPNISITWNQYQWANTPHPMGTLSKDWEGVAEAALSSTRRLIQHFKTWSETGEEMQLYLFIQSIVLSTLLHIFFGLPATPTNVEDVAWIVEKTLRTDDRQQETMSPPDSAPLLRRLVKPSPNPAGVFVLLSATQRLTLGAVCTLEAKREKLSFLRRARALLHNPMSPEPDVTRLVENVKRSNPPIQFVCGGLSLGFPSTHNTRPVCFFIPVDILPPSPCIPGPDGSCISWLHKIALLDRPVPCGGEEWATRATAIILSAIETEVRNANLTVDGDGYSPEAWEDWVLRRLRLG